MLLAELDRFYEHGGDLGWAVCWGVVCYRVEAAACMNGLKAAAVGWSLWYGGGATACAGPHLSTSRLAQHMLQVVCWLCYIAFVWDSSTNLGRKQCKG